MIIQKLNTKLFKNYWVRRRRTFFEGSRSTSEKYFKILQNLFLLVEYDIIKTTMLRAEIVF